LGKCCKAKEKRHAEGNADFYLIKGMYNPSLMLGQAPSATPILEARQHAKD